MRIRAIVPAVLASVALAGCASTANPPASKPATTPASAAPTQPAAVASAASSLTAQQAVLNWFESGGGKQGLQNLAAMTTAVSKVPSGDLVAFGAACVNVQSAVTALQSDGPIPYPPAEKWMAKALAEYSTAAADCQAGVSGQDLSLIVTAASDINAGNADLGKVTDAINALSGQ